MFLRKVSSRITEAGKMDQGALLGWFVHYGDDPAGIATEIRTGRFFVESRAGQRERYGNWA